MRLQDRVAIITGGGHGIGRAYALAMVQEGAKVVIAEVDGAAGEAVAQEVRGRGGQALALATDVASEASALDMARRTVETFGAIHILVNNAAVFATIPISRVRIEEISVAEWDSVMAVNLRGVFLATRAVLPQMKAQGYGKIINISSSTVFSGSATRIHYVTSKAGVIGFTRTLAREVGEYGIAVNAVAPGSTLSEDPQDEVALAQRQRAVAGRSLKRLQLPQDIVGTVLFLASSDSDFITGQTIVVDGGDAMH
ncbi:MAG: SDR family oxidoreductase [Chloroflexi bacterium]|nr:SDR family oxidoreductase [Chloroflexota bacterium]